MLKVNRRRRRHTGNKKKNLGWLAETLRPRDNRTACWSTGGKGWFRETVTLQEAPFTPGVRGKRQVKRHQEGVSHGRIAKSSYSTSQPQRGCAQALSPRQWGGDLEGVPAPGWQSWYHAFSPTTQADTQGTMKEFKDFCVLFRRLSE